MQHARWRYACHESAAAGWPVLRHELRRPGDEIVVLRPRAGLQRGAGARIARALLHLRQVAVELGLLERRRDLGGEHAGTALARTLEWMRTPGDVVFILAGELPLVLALLTSYRGLWRDRAIAEEIRLAGAA